jgi:transposase
MTSARALTPELRQQTPAPVLAYLDELLLRLGRLENELVELRARLQQNSTNSSRPPSSDLPGTRPARKRR